MARNMYRNSRTGETSSFDDSGGFGENLAAAGWEYIGPATQVGQVGGGLLGTGLARSSPVGGPYIASPVPPGPDEGQVAFAGLAPGAIAALLARYGPGILQFLGGLGAGALIGGGAGGAAETSGIPGLGFTPRGPGVPEPPQAMVAKQWTKLVQSNYPGFSNYYIYFFRLIDGRTVLYNPRTRTWKAWRDYRSIVIGKSLTTRNVVAVSRRLVRHVKALNKVLVIIRPKRRA